MSIQVCSCGISTTNPKYCSRSCCAKSTNRIPKRKKTKLCKSCTTLISSKNKYCSICRPETKNWDRLTLNDVASIPRYQIFARIRQIARAVYKQSKQPKCCVVCGYDKHYEICHRIPISTFSLSTPISVINAIENLISLCPNHHWEFDNAKLVVPVGVEPTTTSLGNLDSIR